MKTGDEVRIKDKLTGEKLKGVIINVEANTEMIDVTYGGGLGGPADVGRKFMPGRTTRTITIQVTE